MRVPGLKRVQMAARWLRSRFVDGALILGYHRIAEYVHDPFGICVTPQHFSEQMEVLSQQARPISLQELVQGLENGKVPERAVAVTFDDGYASVLYRAKPLLEHYQTPATVFVMTGSLGREFWWDKLERVVWPAQTLPERPLLPLRGDIYQRAADQTAPLTLTVADAQSRRCLLLALHQRFLPLAVSERQQVLARLEDWAGVETGSRHTSRALTPDELLELASGGSVDIGAHTVTHPVLASLPIEAQRTEIQESKIHLGEILGRPVVSFAYPNGSSSQPTRAIVRESGFGCACASHNDVVWRGSDRFHLPRFWVPDCDGKAFSRWLQRWLHV